MKQSSSYRQSDFSFQHKSNAQKTKALPKKAIWAILISFSVLVVSIYLVRHLQLTSTRGGVFTEGLPGQPRFINPLFSDLNPSDKLLARLVFRSVIKYDVNQKPIADLAKDWQTSSDGKTYIINLNQSEKWQDGRKITADDVVFTYKLTQEPNYDGPEKLSFKNVQIEKTGEFQIKLILNEAFAPFLESLTLGILPKHKLDNQIANKAINNSFNLKPLGSGNFKVEGIAYENSLIKSITLTGQKGFFEKIKFFFYPDSKSLLTALKLGEIDALGLSDQEAASSLSAFKNLVVFQQTINDSQYGLFFNVGKNDLIKNADFRKALALATPKMTNFGDEALGPLPKKSWGFDENEKQISFDLDKAKGEIASLNLNSPSIILTVPQKDPLPKVAEIIKKSWGEIGVKTQIKIVSTNEVLGSVIPNRDFEALIFGQQFGIDPDLYVFWHSTQSKAPGLNLSGFANRRVDKALEGARKSQNIDLRKEDYKNIQTYINEEVPAIFLYQPRLIYFVSKKIKGVKINPIWSIEERFDSFEQWYIKKSLKWI